MNLELPNKNDASRRKRSATADGLPQFERNLLITGILLGGLYLIALASSFWWIPDTAQILVGMTTTNILFGRAAGMSLGYSGGLDHGMVVLVNMLIETIQVLLIYPLFVFSWQHLLDVRILKRTLRRMHRVAENNKNLIERFGIIGLFAFVWITFWMTGPVVGCIIGYLIRLRPSLIIAIVLSGTYLAILGWVFILRKLHDWAAGYGFLITLSFIVGLIAMFIIQWIRRHKKGISQTDAN